MTDLSDPSDPLLMTRNVARRPPLHRQALTLLTGEMAARILGVVTFAILARSLGVERFGMFTLAMSLAMMLGLVVDFGQNSHLGRVVSWDNETGPAAFRGVLINKLVTAVGIIVSVYLIATLLRLGNEELLAIALMLVWSSALSVLDSLRSISRSLGRMRADSTVNALESSGRLLVVCLAWGLGLGIGGFALGFAVEAVIASAFYWVWLSRRHRLWAHGAHTEIGRVRFLLDSLPLGFVGIATSGFYRVDQLLIVPLVSASANGLYGAATRVVFTATVVANLIAVAAYPQMAAARNDALRFGAIYRRVILLCGCSGVCMAGGVVVFAGTITKILYGSAYSESVPLLRFLAVLVVFNAIGVGSIYALAALGKERITLTVVGSLLVINVVGNWLLLPVWGVQAAVFWSIVGEVILATVASTMAWRQVQNARASHSVQIRVQDELGVS